MLPKLLIPTVPLHAALLRSECAFALRLRWTWFVVAAASEERITLDINLVIIDRAKRCREEHVGQNVGGEEVVFAFATIFAATCTTCSATASLLFFSYERIDENNTSTRVVMEDNRFA